MLPEESAVTGLLALGIAPPLSLDFGVTPLRGPLTEAGVEAEMTITRIDGVRVETYGPVHRAVVGGRGRPVALTIADSASGREVEAMIRAVPGLSGLGMESESPNLIGFMPAVEILDIVAGSSAEMAGLKAGDVVVALDGVPWPVVDEVFKAVRQSQGRRMTAMVRRGEETITVEGLQADEQGRIGIYPAEYLDEPIVGATLSERPGATLELAKGSRITTVNGVAIADWSALQHALEAFANDAGEHETMSIEVGYELNVLDRPRASGRITLAEEEIAALRSARWSDPLTAYLDMSREPIVAANPVDALAVGFSRTQQFMLQTYVTLARLFQGTVKVSHLRGPVGIVDEGTRVARQGWTYLLFFLGLISVNLAVINFLPIPIVDGGLMVFLLVEKLKGSPVSPWIQTAATVVGLALIASIFLMTLYFDIGRIMGNG